MSFTELALIYLYCFIIIVFLFRLNLMLNKVIAKIDADVEVTGKILQQLSALEYLILRATERRNESR